MSFVIGQRWISESENNLGLGLITAVDARTVTIFFPASEETRIYAVKSAPLNRVTFNVGDEVTHCEGWKAQVVDVMTRNDVNIYLVKRQDNGEDAVMQELDIAHHITFSKPQDRLFNAQIDRADHFTLRYNSFLHQQAQFQSPLRGLRGAKVGLIPHQLHIANEVGNRIAPRVLLADEVGLGKTIEAGMILQQQILSEKAQRVLIIVPESLQHQWLVEMLRRFNLHFSLFDEDRCSDFDDKGENPFDSENLIICSLDWLMAKPRRAKEALEADFDMLVVDEAHHLKWEIDNPSGEYQLVANFAQKIPGVLLLTATPEQLGQESHFARLHLLDPERFYSFDAFLEEQQNYQKVADALKPLFANKKLTKKAETQIVKLLPEEKALLEAQFSELNDDEKSEEEKIAIRQNIMMKLIDRHGTSRVLFRNTRQGVQGFPKRIFEEVRLPLPSQYQNTIKVMNLLGETKNINLNHPEQMFLKMNPDARWWDFDPRVQWLIDFLKQNPKEKVLVICQQSQTTQQLEQALREKEGINSALFHEKMSIIERDRAAAYFADEEGARVLLSSSVGSEGRNFQFACHLVLFDLPRHPDLLEQCIGRLDRIGQKRDVHIYVPCFENSPTDRLANWYDKGLNAFAETCPMGTAIFERHGETLQQYLDHPENTEGFDTLIKETQASREELYKTLEAGRDRLLEMNSSGGKQAQELAEAIAEQDGSTELVNFALKLFDIVGVEQEDIGEKTIVIKPSSTMLVPDFPYLKEEGVPVTFERDLALARDEVEFLNWDHPMIRNGIDLITTGDIGKSTVSLLINPNLPAGTLLLELIYVVEAQAPKGLQITRFLPPTPIRLLVDMKGNELSQQVPFKVLQKQLRPMKKATANSVVKMMQPQIMQLLATAESKIEQPAKEVIESAKTLAAQTLDSEITRLQALQKVNKNIRDKEIQTLEAQRDQIAQELELARWRLDSLRLIVSNKA
ncbi:RNA polymerase-associated protein RapA [Actinobacillus delphinicola]|uniref:RNA polymerase-associated protein RapA n=1 Tax=Actinobacillus delphinicola TaxID=51161 RepID=A0A448TTD5_9PAST|nr:RNA polymerase-associated protein RapA [Actinobacillus delphinicola]VEJ09093.1 ATP-dependent helicase HepA [Actinobacillus delphinicola]